MAFGGLIGNHVKLFQHNNIDSNYSPVWSRVWPVCNLECFEQITAEFYNHETSNNLQYIISTYIRNYLPTEIPLYMYVATTIKVCATNW